MGLLGRLVEVLQGQGGSIPQSGRVESRAEVPKLGFRGYLQGQIGNPEGEDKPNKSYLVRRAYVLVGCCWQQLLALSSKGYYDPRKWIRECEVTMVKRVKDRNDPETPACSSRSDSEFADFTRDW